MKVLVTGGSGFIGAPVVKALETRGHEVLSCGRKSGIPCDLLDPHATEDLLRSKQPEGLVHLAWETGHGTYWDTTENLRWTGASLYLLEAFARYGGNRVIIAGTSAEYRWDGKTDLSEDCSPLVPESLYGVSKNSLREVAEAWAQTACVSLGWARLFCPFGPGEKGARLIPKLIRRLASGETLDFDSGMLVRDFLHVDELGEGFAAFFDSGIAGAVNLASGKATSIRQVVEWIADSLGADDQIRFGARPDPVGQAKRVVADVSRLRDEVGWRPSRSLKERIRQTCLSTASL